MWKFKDLEIEGKVVLAPMAGVTSLGYRKFMKPFGVSLSYTEMVSDCGLIYENEETKRYIITDENEHPVGIQLFGHDIETIKQACYKLIESKQKFDFVDVNMGCPVPKVYKQGSGSGLMKTPKLCGDIIRAIKSVLDCPVSAKIRLGFFNDNLNYMEVIKELEEAGVDMIAIHARTAKQLYLGVPDFDEIKDLRKKIHVPLVVSGNIYTLDDAIHAIEITGADAVMVARGGMGNPWLIRQIDMYYKTGIRLEDATLEMQKEYCYSCAKYLVEEKGEEKAMRIFRSIGPKFFSGVPNSRILRCAISSQITTLSELKTLLDEFSL